MHGKHSYKLLLLNWIGLRTLYKMLTAVLYKCINIFILKCQKLVSRLTPARYYHTVNQPALIETYDS